LQHDHPQNNLAKFEYKTRNESQTLSRILYIFGYNAKTKQKNMAISQKQLSKSGYYKKNLKAILKPKHPTG